MKRFLVPTVLLVALLVGALGGYVVWSRLAGSGGDDPHTVALPTPRHSEEAATYLANDGRKVLLLHDALADRPDGSDKSECLDFVTRDLASQGAPAEMAARAAATPDQALADMALSEFRAFTTFLAACGSGNGVADASSDLDFAWTVLDRQLRREGVR